MHQWLESGERRRIRDSQNLLILALSAMGVQLGME